jgi:hypothetical protein
MSNKFPVTELDFDQIKSGLKEYLKGQDTFKDYDFEGSNLSVLLDILSYNTFQNNFYTNMAISEMFLDSAQLPDSIVSHAKELNYIPRSRVSARATVDVSFNVNDNPSFIIIPEKTRFTAICGAQKYNFYNERSVTVLPEVNSLGQTAYIYRGLPVFEGDYITEFFQVRLNPSERFVITNSNIDINSIRVFVRKSDVEEEYTYAPDLYGLSSGSKSFLLQPYLGNRYEIYFGKNVFGVEPEPGDVIRIEYRNTAGEEANGAISFTSATQISGYPATISLRSAARGGIERESLKSIKYFAPKSIQVQERAITEKDYEILLKRAFPEIRAVSVFGGERLEPPQYGRVVISVDLQNAESISSATRTKYRNYLRERCSLNIEPVIQRAKYMYYSINTSVNFDSFSSNKSLADIRQAVQNKILNFSDENLSEFKRNLRTSKLVSEINDADENIVSNNTSVRAVIEISPTSGSFQNFEMNFNNRLLKHPARTTPGLSEGSASVPVAIISSIFQYEGFTSFIRDNGAGVLQVITVDQEKVETLLANVGSVDYNTGKVSIVNLLVNSYVGPSIKIFATAIDRDIIAPIDRITLIRPTDINISIISTRA